MEKDKLKVYVVEIMLLIVSFALFVSNMMTKTKLALALILMLVITCLTLKRKKNESLYKRQITGIMAILAFLYLTILYFIGLYLGYYQANIKFGIPCIQKYIIPITVIIIASEFIRNILLAQNAKTKIFSFVLMCLIDVIAFGNIHNINSLEDFLMLVGFTIFSAISNNLLFQYVSIRYGALPIITYRLITILYTYIIPIIPNIDMFFRIVLRIVYPYIIYQILEYAYSKTKHTTSYTDKRKSITNKVILCTVILFITMLISCKFKYGILVLASGSMKGTIDIGDAVAFERYNGQNLEVGEIIVFEKNDMQIVHRIIDIKKIDGQERYYTKGDANQNNDEGYISEKQLIGIIKFKIKYIGYPTLAIRKLFK